MFVCVFLASDSSETVEVLFKCVELVFTGNSAIENLFIVIIIIIVKLGTVTALHMRMHHLLFILTLTFIQGHKCISNLTALLAISETIFKLLHSNLTVYAHARFDDLDLDARSHWVDEGKNQCCMLSAAKQAVSILLATMIGHFLCDLDLVFANVFIACPTCFMLFHFYFPAPTLLTLPPTPPPLHITHLSHFFQFNLPLSFIDVVHSLLSQFSFVLNSAKKPSTCSWFSNVSVLHCKKNHLAQHSSIHSMV